MSATTHSTTVRSGTDDKALKLLGAGYGPEVVASACGVTVSRISQLMSDPVFADQVATLRFDSIQKHNEIDNTYDTLEKRALKQLEDTLPLVMRPMELTRVIATLNAAKRRGQSAPEQITHQNQVVNLTMPTLIVQKFTTNINNQVIQAGSQTLETVQSGALLAQLKQAKSEATTLEESSDGTPKLPAPEGATAS